MHVDGMGAAPVHDFHASRTIDVVELTRSGHFVRAVCNLARDSEGAGVGAA